VPKRGFKSITLKESVYADLEKTYRQNKAILEREGVDSLSSFVARIISTYIVDKESGRMQHFNIYENVIRIKDKKLGRIVDVDYRKDEMYCGLCESTDCVHTGYAWGIYKHYRTMP
jgi:hypothetical protein